MVGCVAGLPGAPNSRSGRIHAPAGPIRRTSSLEPKCPIQLAFFLLGRLNGLRIASPIDHRHRGKRVLRVQAIQRALVLFLRQIEIGDGQ